MIPISCSHRILNEFMVGRLQGSPQSRRSRLAAGGRDSSMDGDPAAQPLIHKHRAHAQMMRSATVTGLRHITGCATEDLLCGEPHNKSTATSRFSLRW
jgi:hypothetical protein